MFDSVLGTFFAIFLLGIFGATLFMLPTLVAYHRKHHQRVAILLLNVLLGLSGIGWIAALVWAATAVAPRPTA